MTHLMTGATGALGHAIASQLRARGAADAWVLGARNPSRLDGSGFASRRVDYDHAPTMREAFEGVSTLLLISSNASNDDRLRQHATAVGAARDAGVERIIYTSFVGADRPGDNRLLQVHHATEARLRESGLPWVALRNGLYLDSLLEMLGPFRETRVVAHPAGDAPVAWISRDDIAELTVDVLLDEKTRNVALDVVPPKTDSLASIVRLVADKTGLAIEYAQPSDEAYQSMLIDAGIDPDTALVLLLACQAMRSGALDVSGDGFEQRLGREPESVASYLGRRLGSR